MNLLCPAITLALVGLTVLTNFFFYSSPQASNEPAPVLLRGTNTVAAGESGGGDYHNDGAAADTTNRLEGRLQEVESLVSELQTRLSNLTRARALDESNHRNESMLDDASSEGNEKKEKNAPKSTDNRQEALPQALTLLLKEANPETSSKLQPISKQTMISNLTEATNVQEDEKRKDDEFFFDELHKMDTIHVSSSSLQVDEYPEVIRKVGFDSNCRKHHTHGYLHTDDKAPSHADRLKKIDLSPGLCAASKSAPKVRRYVVLSEQRSGTSWLANCLNSHPQISSSHESLLYKTPANSGFKEGDSNWIRMLKMGTTLSDWWWQNVYFESHCLLATSRVCADNFRQNGMIAAGFGVQANQGWEDKEQLQAILPLWKENDVRVIVLERRNTVVHSIATKSISEHHSKHTKDVDKVHFEKTFLKELKKRAFNEHDRYVNMIEMVEAARIPLYHVTYEALLNDPGKGYAEIFDFLLGGSADDNTSRWEVETGDVETLHDSLNSDWNLKFTGKSRHNTKLLKDRIDNYNETVEILNDIFPEGICMLEENCDWFYLSSD